MNYSCDTTAPSFCACCRYCAGIPQGDAYGNEVRLYGILGVRLQLRGIDTHLQWHTRARGVGLQLELGRIGPMPV